MAQRNARVGLVLFAVYAAFYAAFVLTNALCAEWMDARLFAGLNLAVLSGFGLIALAMVLALVYGLLAKSPEASDAEGER